MQQSVVDILKGLVSINSIEGREDEICRHIGKFLSDNGFKVEYQEVEPGRNNVFAVKGSPAVIFFGHMDTVQPIGSWQHEPLELSVEGDKAFGLGSWDMKGGLAAILHAGQQAEHMAVVITVDEEEMSKGGWKAVERREFFQGMKGIISAEAGNEAGTYGGPTHLSHARLGRKAFRVTKELPAGHAATSRQDWIEWAYSKTREMPEMKSIIVMRAFHATSKGFSAPDRIEMEIDVLAAPEEKDVDFQNLLSEHFEADTELIERETPYLEPYSFEGHEFINRIAGIIRTEIGEPSFHTGSSVGDENALATLGIPIAIVGPEGRNEHKADEWVSVESLEAVARLYKAIADRQNDL